MVTAKSGPRATQGSREGIPTGQQRLKTLQADLTISRGKTPEQQERAEGLGRHAPHFQIPRWRAVSATLLLTGLLTVLFNRNITGRISALAANIGQDGAERTS